MSGKNKTIFSRKEYEKYKKIQNDFYISFGQNLRYLGIQFNIISISLSLKKENFGHIV